MITEEVFWRWVVVALVIAGYVAIIRSAGWGVAAGVFLLQWASNIEDRLDES